MKLISTWPWVLKWDRIIVDHARREKDPRMHLIILMLLVIVICAAALALAGE